MKLVQKLAIAYVRSKFRLLTKVSKPRAARAAFELFCTPQRVNRNKLPSIFEKAEPVHFLLDGKRVQGWRFNKGGYKKVQVMHGYESSVTNFDKYIKAFVKKGYEVLAFDAPAHGRSEGKKINAPLYARMIKEVNKRFGPVQAHMAHSLGGLATALALEDITHDSTHKLVLIAPATETTSAIDSFFRFLRLDDSLRDAFERVIVQNGGHSASWYSVPRALKHIRAQILWVHDQDDDVTPYADIVKVMEQPHPHLRFLITSGLGHRRIYRDGKVFKEIVDFL